MLIEACMPNTLNILFLEDTLEDAEIAVATLEEAGYKCKWDRVETRVDFLQRLASADYDLVISDYKLPSFDGLTAVKLFVEHGFDIPFLLISGSLGEEAAIESLKAGAADFVLKDKLFRLPFVVDRALKAAYEHRLIRGAEEKIRLQAAALESAANAIVITNAEGSITWVNPAFSYLTGFSANEVIGQNPRIFKSGMHHDRFYQAMWDTLIAGNMWQGELVNRRKDGTTYVEEQTITPVINGAGRVTNFIAIKHDVSERNRAEITLRDSEEKFRQLAESVSDVFYITSPDMSEMLYVSPAYGQIWGRSTESLYANPGEWSDAILPEERDGVIATFLQLASKNSVTSEFRIKRPDGQLRWIQSSGFAVRDSSGEMIRITGTARDITERKEAEKAIAESEEKYRDLVENAIDIIYTHDLKGNYTSVNQAVETITGYTCEEALRTNMADILAPEYVETAKKMIAEKLAGKAVTAYELEILAKNGNRVTVDVNTRIIYDNGVPVGVQGIARDVTDRKRAERDLQFRNLILLTQQEATIDGILVVGEDGKIVSHNRRFVEMFAIPSELLKTGSDAPVLDFVTDIMADPKAFKERVQYLYEHTMETGRDEILLKNGSILDRYSAPMIGPDGRSYGRVWYFRDITEQKAANNALRESNEKFRQLADNINDVFWIRSPDLKEIYYVSPAFEAIWGRPIETAYTNPGQWADFIFPEDSGRVKKAYAQLMSDADSIDLEYRIVREDGSVRWVRARGFQVRDDDGLLIRLAGIVSDITAQKELEEQFRQAQKMEAIGVLAGGVAHDFNNLLTAINGYSDLTLRRMDESNPFRRNIEEIKHAGERAASLTEQLLAFSRKKVLQPTVHNLNPLIETLEKMLHRLIRENIELRTILDPDLGNIRADYGQMEQVIVNLVVNARDAMPDGGRLTIDTQSIYLDKDYVSQHMSVSPGPFVKLSVTDTGHGMDEMTQRRVFDPFFTTKNLGQGTGLGLSMVFGIIKQSGGDIVVSSAVGRGTTFKIYLPCVDEDVPESDGVGENVENISGTETILLLEDEAAVRNLASEVLRSHGYVVLEAASGTEALSICKTYAKPIHLVLSDVIMPKMSGPEAIVRIRELHPAIKVLFMSGYTDDAVSEGGNSVSEAGFIEKPFAPDGLALKVREVLGA